MADFGGMILTDVGLNLQAQVQTGDLLNFTRIAIGDGLISGGLESYTALQNEKMSIALTGVSIPDPPDGSCTVNATLNNEGLSTGFFVREIGLFADDPANPGVDEILYAVAYAPNPDYLPAGGGSTAVEQAIALVVVVANATNISVSIDGSSYITEADLNAHNTDPDAHLNIQANFSDEIDADIAAHNADGDAHPLLRDEIDADIIVHNASGTAHAGLFGGVSDEIDADIAAHNIAEDAHANLFDGDLPTGWDDEVDTKIATHNNDASAHPAIRSEIDSDISAHNNDASAHPAIRSEIDSDISAHNNNAASHDLANKISAIQDEIDSDVNAHNADTSAHSAIQNKITNDIAAHNISASAHSDLFNAVDDGLTAHNNDASAHPAIRSEIDSDISAHNNDASAHPAIRSEIDSDISAHNNNSSAHTAIRTKIGTDIAAHNSSASSHSDIRDRGAIKTIRDNITSAITANVGDRIFANTSGGAFTINMPPSADNGDAVEFVDRNGTWGTNNLTIGRNGGTIMGLSEDMVCDIINMAFRLVKSGNGWRLA